MKPKRAPAWIAITINTPDGPQQGRWHVTGSGASAQITVSCQAGSRQTQVAGMACHEETLAKMLLAEILKSTGLLP